MVMKARRLGGRARGVLRGSSKGLTFLEVLIAMALIGVLAIAFFGAISYASTVLIISDRQAAAESLAVSQLESIKSQDYIDYSKAGHDEYSAVPGKLGYELEVLVEPVDPSSHEPYEKDGDTFTEDEGIQMITVTVKYQTVRYDTTTQSHQMIDDELTLVGYKVRYEQED
jgi:prepilin-type N-terminal cleavage/methylation domain-containing protein